MDRPHPQTHQSPALSGFKAIITLILEKLCNKYLHPLKQNILFCDFKTNKIVVTEIGGAELGNKFSFVLFTPEWLTNVHKTVHTC